MAHEAPIVGRDTPMHDVIYEMSRKGLGMTCVVDGEQRLVGIITDGDLRRHMINGPNFLERSAGDVMTRNPVTIRRDTLAAEALLVLEQRKITSIVVVGDRGDGSRGSCTCTTCGARDGVSGQPAVRQPAVGSRQSAVEVDRQWMLCD